MKGHIQLLGALFVVIPAMVMADPVTLSCKGEKKRETGPPYNVNSVDTYKVTTVDFELVITIDGNKYARPGQSKWSTFASVTPTEYVLQRRESDSSFLSEIINRVAGTYALHSGPVGRSGTDTSILASCTKVDYIDPFKTKF